MNKPNGAKALVAAVVIESTHVRAVGKLKDMIHTRNVLLLSSQA